jgi:hypothetical protein
LPEDQADKGISELLHIMVKILPSEFSDLLYLKCVLGLSINEIALSFNIAETTVTSQLDCVQRVLLDDLLREGITPDKESFLHCPQLQQALSDVMDEEYERIEAELAANPFPISPEFDRRMRELINS